MSNNFLSNIVPFMRKCGKILYSRAGHRWQYGAYALQAVYLRLQMQTQNMKYLLLFQYNNGLRARLNTYSACLV
jgi:hypothetical protein